MEKRLLIALALAAIVILVSQKLFPAPPLPKKLAGDTTVATRDSTQPARDTTSSVAVDTTAVNKVTAPLAPAIALDTISVTTSKAIYQFHSLGAAPFDVILGDYQKLPKGSKQNVVLGRPHVPLLSYALVTGTDTLPLDRSKFEIDSTTTGAHPSVTFKTDVQNVHVVIGYNFTLRRISRAGSRNCNGYCCRSSTVDQAALGTSFCGS